MTLLLILTCSSRDFAVNHWVFLTLITRSCCNIALVVLEPGLKKSKLKSSVLKEVESKREK